MLIFAFTVAIANLQLPSPRTIDTVFPPAGSVLPRNGRIVALGSASDAAFLVENAAGEATTATVLETANARLEDSSEAAAFVVQPAFEDDAITLVPSCPDCSETFDFTVAATDDGGAPRFVDDDLTVTAVDDDNDDSDLRWSATFTLPAIDDDGPTFLRWRGEQLDLFNATEPSLFTFNTATPTVPLRGDADDVVCVNVTVVDVAGNESAPLSTCLDLADTVGCAQAQSSSFAVLGFALLLVRRRR